MRVQSEESGGEAGACARRGGGRLGANAKFLQQPLDRRTQRPGEDSEQTRLTIKVMEGNTRETAKMGGGVGGDRERG